MRICVLNSSYERSESPFRDHDTACDPRRWLPDHDWHRHGIHKATAVRQVRTLIDEGYDLFFNLCDGAFDEDRAGIEVVQVLEAAGQAFTGSGSAFYEPPRETMKAICHYLGIPTPEFHFASSAAEAEAIAAGLRFPMIVKHPSSYGSVGMTRDSRVTDMDGLRSQLARNCRDYGGALVEEFIEGREFTVLVAEPRDGEARPVALVPVEARMPPGETFKHFDLKWVDFDGMHWIPVEDDALAARLIDCTARLFTGMQGSGYGRADLRVDADGNPYILEINANCGIFYPDDQFGSADEILLRDPLGHTGFVRHLIDCALRRQRAGRKAWRIEYRAKKGYRMVATAPIPIGAVLQPWEERPQHLVTRAHVERSWDAVKKDWFRRYAWPLTDEVHVMWSERPEDWQPIDHSCDPNAWLEGLDLVARRAIRPGEPITMDYATFCGPQMEAFACECGAAGCRKRITGADHLSDAVGGYGEHVSDYVRRARAGRGRP